MTSLGWSIDVVPTIKVKSVSNIKPYQEALEGLIIYCNEMEVAIGLASKNNLLKKKTLKRLDKSITIMKAGFKIAKKALKKE